MNCVINEDHRLYGTFLCLHYRRITQCSQIVNGIYPFYSTSLLQKNNFSNIIWGNFWSILLFQVVLQLYLKICPTYTWKIAFFQLNVKMEGVNSIHDLGALGSLFAYQIGWVVNRCSRRQFQTLTRRVPK